MGKLPYIPIYIGDWEQDTNCISIEAEGALIKLIFKLWKSPTKGQLSFSFSQIALLLKKDTQNAVKIVKELQENGVLNIEFLPEDKIKIESRRMLKDIEISKIKSQNGSKGGRGNKSKSKAKQKLTPEYENDIPSLDTLLEYCKEKLGSKFLPLKFSIENKYEAWKKNGWRDGYDEPIKNWKTKIMNVIPHMKPEQLTGEKSFSSKF